MRARMALLASEQPVELREVVLRDKPQEMLDASPKATVPVLIKPDGKVLEESFDVMMWALENNDPHEWLTPTHGSLQDMLALIEKMDGSFKSLLDKYKYAIRHVADNVEQYAHEHRDAAVNILQDLETRLTDHPYLFGNRQSIADVAIAPFIRQFANTDADWFAKLPLPRLQKWLADFISSPLFVACMNKYPKWESGSLGLRFPDPIDGQLFGKSVMG